MAKYKIEYHPAFGYVAFYDASPGQEFGRWWSPIEENTRVGSHGDQYLDALFRGKYFVSTEEEAGARVNNHATRGGAKEIWRG